ncbi:MAG: hypothetical protein ACKVH8_21380, partial [Pirellulales bacterium]
PAVLEHGIDHQFFVSVVNAKEEPADAEVEVVFTSGSGTEIYRESQQSTGQTLGYSLPAKSLSSFSKDESVQLSVLARNGYGGSQLDLPLQTEQQPLVTTLALDRPVAKPGETVRVRSVTVSGLTQQEASTHVRYGIADSEGNELISELEEELTVRGVAANEIKLPRDVTRGRYRLTTNTSGKTAFDDFVYFDVEGMEKPLWVANVEFNKLWFDSGEDVKANIRLNTPAGLPVRNQKFQVQQVVDGQNLGDLIQTVETSDDGEVELDFKLAENVTWGKENHLFLYDEKNDWGYVQPIPVATNEVDVQFYPEGGKLVAGFENRVYFHAVDAKQQPVNINGTIVDSNGKSVAEVNAVTLGRGVFKFAPEATSDNYRLKLAGTDNSSPGNNSPSKQSRVIELPAVQPAENFGLNVSNSVCQADDKLNINVASKVPNQRLGIIAYNNDVPVAQHFWSTGDSAPSLEQVELNIPEEIAGVSRITLYKSEGKEVTPVAERLVYRKPTKQVRLVAKQLSDQYPVGGMVEFEVEAFDENNQPLDAVLGVKVVNESAYARTRDANWNIDTRQLLGARLARADQIEDVSQLLPNAGLVQHELKQLEDRKLDIAAQVDSIQLQRESNVQQKQAGQLAAKPAISEQQEFRSGLNSWDSSSDHYASVPIDPDQQLDLFLGTDGWTNIHVEEDDAELGYLYASNSNRTLVAQEELDLAAGYEAKKRGSSLDTNNFGNGLARSSLGRASAYPSGMLLSDNRDIARSAFQKEVAGYQIQTEQVKSLSGTILVVGGSLVCLSMILLILCRSAGSFWVWGPGVSLSLGCLAWGLSITGIPDMNDLQLEQIALRDASETSASDSEVRLPVMSAKDAVGNDEATLSPDYSAYGFKGSKPSNSRNKGYGDVSGSAGNKLPVSENEEAISSGGISPRNTPAPLAPAVSDPVEPSAAGPARLMEQPSSGFPPSADRFSNKPGSALRKVQVPPLPTGNRPQMESSPDPASISRSSVSGKVEAKAMNQKPQGVSEQSLVPSLPGVESITDHDIVTNNKTMKSKRDLVEKSSSATTIMPSAKLPSETERLRQAGKYIKQSQIDLAGKLKTPANNSLSKNRGLTPQESEYFYQRQVQERNQEKLKQSDARRRGGLDQQGSPAPTTRPQTAKPQPFSEAQPGDSLFNSSPQNLIRGVGAGGGGFGGLADNISEKKTPSQPKEGVVKLEDKSRVDLESRGKAIDKINFGVLPEELEGMSGTKSEKVRANRKKIISRQYAYSGTTMKENRLEEISKKQSEKKSPETIYWNPFLETGKQGKATLSFGLPPEPGKYRISIDAHSNGRLGSSRHTFDVIVPSASSEKPVVDSKKSKTSSKK